MRKISTFIMAASIASALSFSALAAEEERFNATLTLLAPMSIVEVKGLGFEAALANQNVSIVTAATDTKAATFTARGTALWEVQGSVVESSIDMTTGDGSDATKTITVSSFTYAGDMDASGVATFNGSGELSNLRVGATAEINSNDIAGDYSGEATFRLTYL